MLRILPYVIVLLAVFGFSRFMNIFNDGTGVLDILNLHAAESDNEKTNSSEVKIVSQSEKNNKESSSYKETEKDSTDNLDNNKVSSKDYQDPAYTKYKYQVSSNSLENQGFSPVEIEILQNLRQKSKEIDAREEELMIKESSLNAISQMLDAKIQSLAKTQEQLNKIASQYEGDEAAKVDRIVKVYENMKPKEAAKIFNELQINVLLPVVDKMKEQKLAAIIADMDAIKAKDLTTSMANKSRILNLLN